MTRTVLVTGATRNIGRHLAHRFGEQGYRVAVCARRPSAVDHVVAEIRDAGGQAIGVPADVSDPYAVREAVAVVDAEFGGVDVLVNNAVVRVQRPIQQMSLDEWHVVLRVVLDGAFNCTQAVLPRMREQRWGRVINVTGTSALKGSANRVGVVTAKLGLHGFTRAIAREVAADGITVNSVSPGRIDTERGEWTTQGDVAGALAHYDRDTSDIPVERLGTLDEVCAAFLFLASDDAAFVTGDMLCVNGGIFMR